MKLCYMCTMRLRYFQSVHSNFNGFIQLVYNCGHVAQARYGNYVSDNDYEVTQV